MNAMQMEINGIGSPNYTSNRKEGLILKIDIKHLAMLSRLKITDEQEQQFETQLESIVELCEKLPEISSTDSLLDQTNPMKCREDVAHNDFKRDDILRNAPQVQAGCIVVPKIIE